MRKSIVHIPVGPAPKISTVSPGVMSAMRTDQKPVAKISPTNNACSSRKHCQVSRLSPDLHKEPARILLVRHLYGSQETNHRADRYNY